YDPDGDALVFSSKKLPPGAELDPATGMLRWTPNYSSPFDTDLDIPIRVTDGKLSDELTIKLHVDNRSIGSPGKGFDILVATRSPDRGLRAEAIAELMKSQDLATDAKILELARLLRDFDDDVASRATAALRDLPVKDGDKLAIEARRSLVALDLAGHTWQLSDRPAALALMKELVKTPLDGAEKAVGVKIQKDVAAIEKYNRDRVK
ncbi:MAG: hypothetical protein ACAI25_17095, partial [Planctomycetota bacterium]